MLPGGKRIRPKLSFLVADLINLDPKKLIATTVAMEFLHTASLAHDDLPALDNDDMRRGRESLHKAYGESTAILAADYMIGYAFELIANDGELASDAKVAVIQELSKTWGLIQEGQVLDLKTGAERPTNALSIYEKKTAALIESAFVLPALIHGDLGRDVNLTLRKLGRSFGLLFQVADDLIDGSVEKGRGGVASDNKNSKVTIVTKSSTDELTTIARALKAEAEELLSALEDKFNKKCEETRKMLSNLMP
jgi:geranylgeranyl pyrophosphate synthase